MTDACQIATPYREDFPRRHCWHCRRLEREVAMLRSELSSLVEQLRILQMKDEPAIDWD